MNNEESLAIARAVADLDEPAVLAMVRQHLAAGEDPLAIIDACEAGMRRVGEYYEAREYYISGLIMAGEIFREVLEMVQPSLEHALAGRAQGKVLIGTVQGDIHDIGKAILHVALRSHGFTVEDLGIDVPPQAFVERALAWQPDVIGLSCLLTTAYDSMRETVRLLWEQVWPAGRPAPIVIGGGLMSERVCRYVGADHWSADALQSVRLCERLVARANL